MRMKKGILILVILAVSACGEKLMKKPENLIPKEKMIEILSEMAIVNSAKSTNITILRDNNIDPTEYVFKKFAIDSIRFVESDRYYASVPAEYEAIYTEVEIRLTNQKKELEDAKILSDSLRRTEIEAKKLKKDTLSPKFKDSLP